MQKDLLIKQLKALTEANAEFFLGKADPNRYARSKNIPRYYQRVLQDGNKNAVLEWLVPSSKPGHQPYFCYVDIITKQANLFNLAKSTGKLRDRVQILRDADIKLFCTCDDFNWSGMKYNLKHGHDSLAAGHHSQNPRSDHGEDIPPDVRDPERKNLICKHLITVLKGIAANAPSIMKDARTYVPEQEPEKPEPEINIGNPPDPNIDANKEQLSEERMEAIDKAMGFFQTSEPIKTEETQQALDSMSDQFVGPESPVPVEPDEPEEDEDDEQEIDIGLVGPDNEQPTIKDEQPVSNNLADLEKESQLDIFNQPVDEDETENSYS